MGIPHLNRYIIDKCRPGVLDIKFSDISGKVIAVDIMIYLYKFMSEDLLMENMYTMMALFRHYNITPIFIFDGKPPAEKEELLKQRADEKRDAENMYDELKQRLEKCKTKYEYDKVEKRLSELKKKCVKLSKTRIEKVKDLIDAYGMIHHTPDGEADPYCAQLVKKNYAYACLSEDMDQFVYGTPRVLRYLNIKKETMCIYTLKKILQELNMSHENFKDICVLSGTDYNISNTTNLFKTLKLYARYKYSKKACKFYEWLEQNTKYIDDMNLLINTHKMFTLNNDQIYLHKRLILNNKPN